MLVLFLLVVAWRDGIDGEFRTGLWKVIGR